MSFGIAPNFEEPDCLAATGVLSLSFSEDLKGVEGTFKGCGGILGHETRTDKVEMGARTTIFPTLCGGECSRTCCHQVNTPRCNLQKVTDPEATMPSQLTCQPPKPATTSY